MTELRQFRKTGHHKCTIRRACLRANEQLCILPAEVERTNVYRCCTAASTIESPSENGNPARETGTQSQASLVEAPDYRRGEEFHRPGHVGKFFYSGVPKMRARSRVATWLSYPDVKAARVALAAGSLAGLAVLGACSEGTVATKVAGPKVSPPVSEPSFVGVVGANSHTVQVCVDNASPAGTYNFAVSHNNVQSIMLELPSS